MLVRILDILIAGLVMGGIYSLAAVGLNLQYGVLRVLNMAHGEFIMLGAYIGYWCFTLFGINPLITLLISIPLLFILGFVINRLVFQPLRLASETIGKFEGYAILASYGLIFTIQNIATLAWGGRLRTYSFLADPVNIFGAIFAANRLITLLLATLISIAFYVFLTRTRIGKGICAIAQDAETAKLMGINVNIQYGLSFAMGAVMAGLAGVLLSMMFPATPSMGFPYTVIAVVIIVLGGLGNIVGSLISAFILGIIGSVVLATEPGLLMVAFYMMFLTMLLIRPTGILSSRG